MKPRKEENAEEFKEEEAPLTQETPKDGVFGAAVLSKSRPDITVEKVVVSTLPRS